MTASRRGVPSTAQGGSVHKALGHNRSELQGHQLHCKRTLCGKFALAGHMGETHHMAHSAQRRAGSPQAPRQHAKQGRLAASTSQLQDNASARTRHAAVAQAKAVQQRRHAVPAERPGVCGWWMPIACTKTAQAAQRWAQPLSRRRAYAALAAVHLTGRLAQQPVHRNPSASCSFSHAQFHGSHYTHSKVVFIDSKRNQTVRVSTHSLELLQGGHSIGAHHTQLVVQASARESQGRVPTHLSCSRAATTSSGGSSSLPISSTKVAAGRKGVERDAVQIRSGACLRASGWSAAEKIETAEACGGMAHATAAAGHLASYGAQSVLCSGRPGAVFSKIQTIFWHSSPGTSTSAAGVLAGGSASGGTTPSGYPCTRKPAGAP